MLRLALICTTTCLRTKSRPRPRAIIGNYQSFYPGSSSFTCMSYRVFSLYDYSCFSRLFIIFVSFILLTTNPYPDPTYRNHQISLWATFLGVTSALLAALQYAPQIAHTYRMKLVGALSIKMMLIQSPGALFMVLSIALRSVSNFLFASLILINYLFTKTWHKLDQ